MRIPVRGKPHLVRKHGTWRLRFYALNARGNWCTPREWVQAADAWMRRQPQGTP